MARAHRFLYVSIPLIFLYILALFQIIPLPLIGQETSQDILPAIPFWFIVTFGAYSLASLGLGLLRFKECPQAYEELLVEINQAKNELRDQGVSVD